MLILHIAADEAFNETTNEFVELEAVTLKLEYSLVSLSKWEEIREVPFLTDDEHSTEDTILFIKCMCVDQEMSPEVFSRLKQSHLDQVAEYVNRKMTATYFSQAIPEPKSGEPITAELIYYWMISLNIDWEAKHWHLNKLFTLIKVCNLKNAGPKQLSSSEARARTQKINAANRQKYEPDR